MTLVAHWTIQTIKMWGRDFTLPPHFLCDGNFQECGRMWKRVGSVWAVSAINCFCIILPSISVILESRQGGMYETEVEWTLSSKGVHQFSASCYNTSGGFDHGHPFIHPSIHPWDPWPTDVAKPFHSSFQVLFQGLTTASFSCSDSNPR